MKRLVSAFLAGAMALSLAACGGAASTSTVASSASASGRAAASETAASDLDYIKEKGKMVIGYTVYEPMNYTDADGNFTGFDTELATAVCEKLGVEPEFVEINWDTKVVELDAKSIDCIWNGMTLTDDIMANTATTKAYAKNAQVVVVKDGTDYSSTADLVGKTVVAEAGSAGEAAIEGDENLAQADYVSKSVQTDCLMEVAAGTADAAVLDLTLANAMIGEGTDYASLKIVDELNAEEYGVAFRKGSDAAAAVDAAFDELKADVRKKLEENAENAAANSFENAVTLKLIEKVTDPIPHCMFEHRADSLMNQFANQLKAQGVSLDLYLQYTGMDQDSLKETYLERAENEVKLRLALEKITELEKLEVSDEDLEAEVARLAEENNMTPDDVKKRIYVEDLRADMLATKAMDLVKESAVATDAPAEEETAAATEE